MVDGETIVAGPRRAYPALDARFADLLRRGRSEVDLTPLTMTLDALALGQRERVPVFEG